MTPILAAARLHGRRGRVLLHSARDDDGLGTWSFVTAEPTATLIARGRSLVRGGGVGKVARVSFFGGNSNNLAAKFEDCSRGGWRK